MRLSHSFHALLGVSMLTGASFGGAIVNDTWLDGTRSDPAAPTYSENGTDTDSDGNLEAAWFLGGGGTLNPLGPGGPLQAVLGATGSSSYTAYFTPDGSPVELANPGDSLKVKWVFRPLTVNASNTSQNFRLAIVDSPNASRLSVDGAPGNGIYTGYGMFMNMAQTLGNGNPFRLMERTNPASSTALLSSSGEWTGLANGATSGNVGYASGVEYTFEMSLTRNALNGIDLVSSMTGGNLNGAGFATVSFTDSTPNGGSFRFDTFSIRPSDAATTAAQFDTSLFQVDVVVPEPASGLLILSAGLLGRRRK